MPYISTGTEELHYLRIGSGGKIILAFHGYGEHAGTFSVFGPVLEDDYTLLCFDLPYHGQTAWKGKPHLDGHDLATLVDNVRAEYKAEKVSLMGYSIGGRICLATMMAAPRHIASMLLMATDGLVVNRFYWLLTRTAAGGMLFRHFVRRAPAYLPAVKLVHTLGLIPDSLYKLAMQAFATPARRTQLLNAWPCLSLLISSPQSLRATINQHHIPLFLFMGANDRVLPPALGRRFAQGVATAELIILEKGHRIFDAGNVGQIAAPLLQI